MTFYYDLFNMIFFKTWNLNKFETHTVREGVTSEEVPLE